MFTKMNGLEKLLWVFGVLAIVGGFVVAAMVGPGDPGDGYIWKATAYLGMIVAIASGIISGVAFMAFSRVVFHLRTISEELQVARQRAIAAEIRSPSAKAELGNDLLAHRPYRSTGVPSEPSTSSQGGFVIQTPSGNGPKAKVWTCKKCGVTNPMSSNVCKGCATYR